MRRCWRSASSTTADGADVGFDPEHPATLDDRCRVRTKNTTRLLTLETMDWGVSPTAWQRAQFPPEFVDRISAIHDGIDIAIAVPDAGAAFMLPNGRRRGRGDEVVTYVARDLEPYRGFPSFMRAAAELCRRRPGPLHRLHPLRPVHPCAAGLIGARVSHLSVRAVLADAGGDGGGVPAGRFAPVLEVIEDGRNGLLVDFFSHRRIAERIEQALAGGERWRDLCRAARETVLRSFELRDCVARQIRLLGDVAARRRPQDADAPADPVSAAAR